MKKFISYPKIGQFNQIIKGIIHSERYDGLDEQGEAIYNNKREPIIRFKGSVKLHGSNSGIIFNSIDGMWVQSRNNIITVEKDNAGCAFQAYANKEAWQKLIDKVIEREGIDPSKNNICIFSEWCGGSIQKGVAISGLDKMNVIFGVKIAPFDEELPNYWVNENDLSSPEHKIYNINDFQTFEIEIDFKNPKMSVPKMEEIVDLVEKECPVGKQFGRVFGKNNTIGEGVVWKTTFKGNQYLFKTKGEKHAGKSKVKTLIPVDIEKLESVNAFVEKNCNEARLNQGIEQVFTTTSTEPSQKSTGEFIRWVVNDITNEEMDSMVESKIEPKDVNKAISVKAKDWFFEFLNNQVM